jgi:hypothetical protein
VIDATPEEQNQAVHALSDRLRAEGKRAYVVRMANDEDLAPDVIGYIECFCEIVEQSRDLDRPRRASNWANGPWEAPSESWASPRPIGSRIFPD